MYSAARKRYVTVLLLSIYVFNQADRSIFGILMEPIKRTLFLSDTQLGFMAGPALVVLYVTLGVPIARLADRSHRVNLMTASIAVWSCMVMMSATVGRSSQLALTRMGVGVGEAGFSAIAQSLIADYHEPTERTRAMSVFMLGIPLGGVVSYLMGGWVNQVFGWRLAFLVAGLPGIALCVLLKWTVQEPSRTGVATANSNLPSLRSVLAQLWQRRALRHLVIAQAVLNIVLSSERIWLPTFLIRTHGLATGRVGTSMAIAEGVGGGVGIWLGGYLANRYGAEDQSIQARAMAIATGLAVPVVVTALWCPFASISVLLWVLSFIPMFFFLGPIFSLVQSLCAPNVRATIAALFILFQVLAGGVVGVQVLGIISDALTPRLGSANALRWAMTLVVLLAPWAVLHFYWAAHAIREDASLQSSSPLLEAQQ